MKIIIIRLIRPALTPDILPYSYTSNHNKVSNQREGETDSKKRHSNNYPTNESFSHILYDKNKNININNSILMNNDRYPNHLTFNSNKDNNESNNFDNISKVNQDSTIEQLHNQHQNQPKKEKEREEVQKQYHQGKKKQQQQRYKKQEEKEQEENIQHSKDKNIKFKNYSPVNNFNNNTIKEKNSNYFKDDKTEEEEEEENNPLKGIEEQSNEESETSPYYSIPNIPNKKIKSHLRYINNIYNKSKKHYKKNKPNIYDTDSIDFKK